MVDAWVIAGLILAAFAGWGLARSSLRFPALLHWRSEKVVRDTRAYLPQNIQADKTIEAFIRSIDVHADTVAIHQALGNLLRDRGQVDQAVRIRQNLWSNSQLSSLQKNTVRLELARDYMAAGLLDRAEKLLRDLARESAALRAESLVYLVEIYQDEKEWEKARRTVHILQDTKMPAALLTATQGKFSLAHCYCELAMQEHVYGSYQREHSYLKEALAADKHCIRALQLMAQLQRNEGHYRQAIRLCQRIRERKPGYVLELLPLLRDSYHGLGDMEGLRSFLQETIRMTPSIALGLELMKETPPDSDSSLAAQRFVEDRMQRKPSLWNMDRYLALQLQKTEGEEAERLGALRKMVQELLLNEHLYLCANCGFKAKQLYWRCPGCKHWDTIHNTRE